MAEDPPQPPSMRPRPSLAPRPTRLGRYDVIGKIASGGMASIYLARSSEPDAQVVALKVMRHDDEDHESMFLDEAALQARLVHPNIVRTLETGAEGDQQYIAMELLLGTTLGKVFDACVERGLRLEPDVVAWVAARIGDALAYAHALTDESGAPLEIIHRDVNPSNVFLTFDGGVKLFDFGMAKAASRRSKTAPGVVKGKLPYLAPEQIMQLPIDCRADLFGLGTTTWELLTMRRLFQRDTDVETVRAVHVGPIPDVRQIAPETPARVAEIVQKALQRSREHRYASAGDFAHDLDGFVGARAANMPARLGALLDALFPGERKRQLNWLKPAVSRPSVPPPASKR